MRHFFRTQLTPLTVLRIADEFFPEIGMERSGHTSRSRTFSGDLGTLQLSVRMEGGHYTFVEVSTDQMGESRSFLSRSTRQATRDTASKRPTRMARSGTAASRPANLNKAAAQAEPGLSRENKLEMYDYMRLTRSLEERLVNLYRQTKVVGGLFRSLGQEADAVGSAYALDRSKGDVLSPLIRNLGSMLVQGARPNEIIKQYMAKGDSPTRGRELNIHYGDLVRGFIGQISPLGDMVAVMAGVTLSFKMRGEQRVGLVPQRDGGFVTWSGGF